MTKIKTMKLKKGSAEAKRFMASIRAKKKGAKKTAVKKTAVKKAPKKTAVKKASTHKDTKSHNVRISVISGNKEISKEIFKNTILQVKGLLFYLKKANGATLRNPNRNTYFTAVNYKINEVERLVKEILKLK